MAWSPDSRFFVTASRDHAVKLWAWREDGEGKFVQDACWMHAAPATAVAVSHRLGKGLYVGSWLITYSLSSPLVVAVGLETGEIQLYRSAGSGSVSKFEADRCISTAEAHTGTVTRLKFRPSCETLMVRDRD